MFKTTGKMLSNYRFVLRRCLR